MASTKPKALALTRVRPAIQAAPTTNRIPAFLNKLYQMVGDAETNHLIEWADDGDSFYVYNQEQFARDVLPHWFKHQNFASFVRQLNMYGFHKVPHLQQGVLKSDADAEYWNFEHVNFRRDQPDLLCLIQRKKSANVPDEDKAGDGGNTAHPTSANGQMLDLQSIVNGISTIKRHQTAISAELSDLRRSNELLWKESEAARARHQKQQDTINRIRHQTAISAELSDLRRSNELLWKESEAARARHQKQQDTINRIVKFLAGVFGNHVGVKDDVVAVSAASPSRVVVPRRQSRLMIEGAAADPTVESPAPYATIETPISIASPIEPGSPKAMSANFDSPVSAPITLTPEITNHDVISTQSQYPDMDEYAMTPSRSPNPDIDNIIQNTLSNMTPAQIQQLFNSITMPATYTEPVPGGSEQQLPPPQDSSSLMSYQPPIDFSQFAAPFSLLESPQPPSVDPSFSEKVDKSWKAAQDIEHDVDAVDNRINNLFQQFQLPGDGSIPTFDGTDPNAERELFQTFLHGMDEPMIDTAAPSTAFLDEIPDGTHSPVAEILQDMPGIQGKKRKSTAGLVEPIGQSPEAPAKRRKEK
uniref:Transcriptional factor n=1 Tax=Mycena chlorophos TaxID=658473 RepID=A0ABQ0MD75_MYCCL|nr:transcriptional factor [Mycena chlorophos]